MSFEVANVLFIQGDVEEVREIYEKSRVGNDSFTLEGVVPSSNEEKVKNWSTPKDAQLLELSNLYREGNNQLRFDVAFFTELFAPLQWFATMTKKYPNIYVQYWITDEDGFGSKFVYDHGVMELEFYKPKTIEFYDFLVSFPIDKTPKCNVCEEALTESEFIRSVTRVCKDCIPKLKRAGDSL